MKIVKECQCNIGIEEKIGVYHERVHGLYYTPYSRSLCCQVMLNSSEKLIKNEKL